MKIFIWRGRTVALTAAALMTAGLLAMANGHNRVLAVSAAAGQLPVYSVETDQDAVALGINCAWGNEDVDEILAALDKAGVKATFFILGEWCEKYPESVQKIASRGHEIASHSYTHRDMNTLDGQELREEISKAMAVLQTTCGCTPRLIRPPSGAYDSKTIATICSMGYIPIQWDVDTLDWKGLLPEEMVQRVEQRTKSGSILLLHAGAKHTAQALPQLLQAIQGLDLHPIPVGQLIYTEDYTIDIQGRQHRSVSLKRNGKFTKTE